MGGLGIDSADLVHSGLLILEREAASERPVLGARPSGAAADLPGQCSRSANARLRALVAEHFDFIWRSMRRIGVPSTDVDDCVQQVFWVAARKLTLIDEGSERAFLFSTALRVASDARRTRTRRREVPEEDNDQYCDPAPAPDELVDQRRARVMLEEVLSAMPMDLRAVFVLFELEEMSTNAISALLEIPGGTVASRLRRAREEFHGLVGRLKARDAFRGAALSVGEPRQPLVLNRGAAR